ncbi:MAG: hypothetical protein PHY47_00715 [Lachnospiraceae bacterium]|nr:hypothetical protein [Lachnospiraceae bacterium]
MKFLSLFVVLFFTVNTFANTHVNINVRDFSKHICESNNAFNMKGCIEELSTCIEEVMSRRVYISNENETRRFIRAVSQCTGE